MAWIWAFNFWLGFWVLTFGLAWGFRLLSFGLFFSKIASLKHHKMVRFGPPPQSGSQNCSKTGGLILTSSWPLGALLDASGAEKKILGAALGRSKRNSKRGFSYLGGQKAPKTEPGRVPNRVPEATRTKNVSSCKTMFFLMDCSGF